MIRGRTMRERTIGERDDDDDTLVVSRNENESENDSRKSDVREQRTNEQQRTR